MLQNSNIPLKLSDNLVENKERAESEGFNTRDTI